MLLEEKLLPTGFLMMRAILLKALWLCPRHHLPGTVKSGARAEEDMKDYVDLPRPVGRRKSYTFLKFQQYLK